MKLTKKFLLAALAGLLASSTMAQSSDKVTIEKVEVRGNRRIPQDTIFYYIMNRAGDVFDRSKIQMDFQALYKTGLFKNLKVDVSDGESGKIIAFIVDEKPIIRAIEYEGVKSFKKSDILDKFNEEKLGLTVDSPYEPTKMKKAERIIKNLLVNNGRPLGTVTAAIDEIPPNSVRVTFKVDEGEKVRIGQISFSGNTIFSDRKLKASLKLNKERSLLSIFKGTDKYHHDKLLYDLEENLKAVYQQQGYLDMKYGEPSVKIAQGPRGFIPLFRKTKKQFFIDVPIDEGPQYKVSSLTFEGNTLFKGEQLSRMIGLEKGQIANFKAVKDGMESIKKLYGMYGYIDFDINPNVKTDKEKLTVDIAFSVEQGKQYKVNRVEFFGNTRTRDKVLRREFQLVEQELFSQTLLDLSVQRLNQLGLFEKIEEKDYEVKRNQEDATVDVNVTVQEKGQQSIGVTGGVSGYQGSFLGLNYSTNNFLGYGEKLSLDATIGTKMLNASFSFTDPYFLDTNTLFGFSLYKRRYKYDINDYTGYYNNRADAYALYTQRTTGFNVTFGRPLSMFWRFYTTYELQNMAFPLNDIKSDYRWIVESQLFGVNPGVDLNKALSGLIRSEVTARLDYNSTDDFYFPRRGKEISLSCSVSGGPLGGDFNLISPRGDLKWYLTDRLISRGRHVLAIHANAQYTSPFKTTKAVPFFERFFMGGEYDIRGFDIRGVSPWAVLSRIEKDNAGNPIIDPVTGLPRRQDTVQPIGGDLSLLGQVEYRIPLVGPVRLSLFADAGLSTIVQKSKLGFSPDTNIYLLDSTNRKLRTSTGAEFQIMLPMINAPFRLIFSYNPNRINEHFVTKDHGFDYREPRTNVLFSIGKSF